jgi:serine protease
MVSRLIIKPRVQAGGKLTRALDAHDASSLSQTANVPLTVVRPMSGGAHVVKLDQPVTLSEARVIAERLMRNDYSVELAEPDRVLQPAFTPSPLTNPDYATKQWHYFTPAGANKGGANLPGAWDTTLGSNTINVAVLDTGFRQHADLGTVLQGYDFITDATRANDGDGRDADAQDPGDWVAANECGAGAAAKNSSWHGTHVAGTIAALMDNSNGGTGVAPNVKILPVRVLGKCGGLMSDIIDGMRWAAGLAVVGVPANANAARVLNMSLGGVGVCSVSMQSAVTEIVNAGKAIVAASGNSGTTTVGMPANCTGVIAVTAHAIDGDNAGYSDIGPQVAISGPGGGCGTQSSAAAACTTFVSANGLGVYSTLNSGTNGPVTDNYTVYQGTSMATPHVAGVAALMLSINPGLTPAQIKSYLQSSARAHPAGTTCTIGANVGKCGSGLLDAQMAASAANAVAPTANVTNPAAVVAPGATVTLAGSGTAGTGRTINSYAWTQISGPSTVVISNSNTASATFTAPASGSYVFRLTVTDNGGNTGFVNSSTVRVNSVPVLTAETPKTVIVGNPLAFKLTATDADGDTPIFVSVALPTGATLSATGDFNWPSATPVGPATLTYYARDNDGNSATGTVNITVAPVPVAAASSGSSGGGGSLDGESLIGLAFLAACLRLRRKFASA